MAKVLIVYWSTTWNTETVADHIKETLEWEWNEVDLKTWTEVSPEQINDYDVSFLSSPTWWDGEIQDDMIDFVENLKTAPISWKNIAIFACGMSSFPQFCHAWDLIKEAAIQAWAEPKWEIFQIDWDVWDELDNAWDWAKKIINL